MTVKINVMNSDLNKDKWIDQVMNSTKGMNRAQPAPGMYKNITSALSQPQPALAVRVPFRQWAAAAIIILAVNVSSVLYFTSRSTAAENTNGTSNPLAAEMQTGSTYNY